MSCVNIVSRVLYLCVLNLNRISFKINLIELDNRSNLVRKPLQKKLKDIRYFYKSVRFNSQNMTHVT